MVDASSVTTLAAEASTSIDSTTPSVSTSSTTPSGSASLASPSSNLASITTTSSNTTTSETSTTVTYPTDLSTLSFRPSSATHSSTSSISSGTVRPTSDHASQTTASGSRFGAGTLAGAIVGSFMGGCILTFVVAFLLLRRRKKAPSSSEKREHTTSDLSESPKGPAKGLNKISDSSVDARYEGISYVTSNVKSFDLSPYIPESADDTTICMRIQTFFDQISLHIDNYYSRPNSAPRLNQEEVVRISDYDSPFLGVPLASLLSGPRSQRAVLTHILVHTLVESIHPGSQTRSLLPACYCLDRDSRENESLMSDDDRAIFAWRMLTSHLHARAEASQSAMPVTRNDVIAKITNDFNQAFAPFGDPLFSQADRLAHLQTVVREASGLGVWLFSQPCSFEFHWSTASKTSKYITVLPSVIKVYDEQGRPLVVPQTLLAETKAQI